MRLLTIVFVTITNLTIMAKEVKIEIRIEARPEKVWAILTDFGAYPNWNPFIKSLKGEVEVGHKINVHLTPPDAKSMTFKPKVKVFEKNRELRWLGRFILPGIFDGEHSFLLIDNGDGTTTFIHKENFRGILVPFMKKQLDNNTRRGFEEMNNKLKELAESNS
jgi:hypothetical protein